MPILCKEMRKRVLMQISSTQDAATLATLQSQQKVKEQMQVSLLKKMMEQTRQMMQELQKSLQPPKNDQGSISLYA